MTTSRRGAGGALVMARRELLGAGLAGALGTLLPAGLTRAAAQAPVAALLLGYPLLHQRHVLSCEAAVASMATRGRLSEQWILDRMPHNLDPWLGFRGNVDGGQSLANGLANYGIYAPPLASELRAFGYPARAIRGGAAPALLRHGIGVLRLPVAIWVTHYLRPYPAIAGRAAGHTFALIDGEHCRLAIGYDAYGLHSLDPLQGRRYDPWDLVLRSWARFEHMGIIVGTAGHE